MMTSLPHPCIYEFVREHRFLSNFYPSEVTHNGLVYPTIEHWFQAHKATNESTHLFILKATTPSEAKSKGRKTRLRPDWEQIKDQVMWDGLMLKFQDSILAQKLRDTRPYVLVEGNTWGDVYWGYDLFKHTGLNKLGTMLESIRAQL